MRPFAILAVVAALAGAKAGPDTALSLEPVEPMFRFRVVERGSCPPSFDLELAADMPDPGWSLAVDRVSGPDPNGRRIVEITATRAEGMFAQVLTARTATANLGVMRKGVHLVDVHLRRGEGRHERVQAIVLRGAGLHR